MSKLRKDAEATFEVGKIIDGRYKVVRLIGQGGNGLVHEVEHVMSGRRLALKSLLEEAAVGRLEQEARAAALMRNRHAVMITDMGQSAEIGPYLVMELLEGQSLRALLEETGQLPLEMSVNIALQVCECLEEAHAQGLVHRDLKPDNIYLCPVHGGQFDIKVLDFGVVKIAGGGPIPNSSLTRTGSTVGTPFYMSLEQLRNSSNVDARSDIYALSVVLYEALSGNKPFQAETIGDLVYALCSGPPTPLERIRPELPKNIVDTIMRGLSSNRDDRPGSMHELATVLAPHGDPAFAMWLRTGVGTKSMTVPRTVEEPDTVTKPPEPKKDAPSAPPRVAEAPRDRSAPPTPPPPPPPKPSDRGVPRADSPGSTRPPPRPGPSPLAVARSAPSANATTTAMPATELQRPPAAPSAGPTVPITTPPPPPLAPDKPKVAAPPLVTRPTPPTPSGDRDTPTEMYVKDVHGADGPPGPPGPTTKPLGQRDTPTEAIEGFQEKLHASIAQTEAYPPLVGSGDTAALPALSDEPDLRTRRMEPGTFPVDNEGPTFTQLGPHHHRASWQRAIENAGQTMERWTVSAANAFRGATPQQQLIVVVVGASILGVLVVLILYSLFASSAPMPP